MLDLGTVYAAPITAMLLGDWGADVIKVEHPRGDPARTHGLSKDGHGLWWKVIARNKRTITLNFGKPDGQDILRRLVAQADVVIENFRPGVMEKWGLGPEELQKINPELVVLRVTGFGQKGPYASRRAFGTLAEAMSGLAHQTGEQDGPPTLPPFGLADGVAGLTGAYAVMLALYHRDVAKGGGQVIDLSLLEPLVGILGPGPSVYDQLGLVSGRHGNRSSNNAPRNAYLTSDGRWVAISASATSVAERVMNLVGRPDIAEQSWFPKAGERVKHADMIDAPVAEWIGARPMEEVSAAFQAAGAALAPVYDVEQLMNDPHVLDRDMITTIDDEDLGPLKMQNLIFRMGNTPGSIRHGGRRLGQDTDGVLDELLGISDDKLDELRDKRGRLMDRSYLFAPGHNAKLLDRVFRAGADAVMLDLEDAVPPEAKPTARAMVAEALLDQPAWVRVNAAQTAWCEADLDAVADRAFGIRIPKVESAADVEWVTARAPGKPIICAIESARGVLAAQEIAAVPGVRFLAMGGVDLQRDLNTTGGNLQTLYARSHLVLASRAAGIEPPIDSVFPLLDDADGLRDQAQFARSLGFFGKSAIHPKQLPTLHEVFTPTRRRNRMGTFGAGRFRGGRRRRIRPAQW